MLMTAKPAIEKGLGIMIGATQQLCEERDSMAQYLDTATGPEAAEIAKAFREMTGDSLNTVFPQLHNRFERHLQSFDTLCDNPERYTVEDVETRFFSMRRDGERLAEEIAEGGPVQKAIQRTNDRLSETIASDFSGLGAIQTATFELQYVCRRVADNADYFVNYMSDAITAVATWK